MIRITCVIFLAAGLGLAGCAEAGADETPRAPAEGPRITFERMDHAFGRITDTDVQTISFPFRNTGSEELVISQLKPSCGCTTPKLSQSRFLPGESDAIVVKFNPRGKHGPTNAQITVVTNARPEATIKLKLSAQVEPMINCERFMRMDRVPLGRDTSRRFEITYDDPGLRIGNIAVNNPHVTARVVSMGEPAVSQDGRAVHRGVLEITVSKDAPWGLLYATNLKFIAYGRPAPGRDPVEYEYTVFINGQVVGNLTMNPPIITFVVQPDQPFEGSTRLVHTTGAPFQVLGVEVTESTMPGIRTRFEPVQSGVRIVLYGTAAGYRGPIKGAVTVTTDVPGEESLVMRFAGRVE